MIQELFNLDYHDNYSFKGLFHTSLSVVEVTLFVLLHFLICANLLIKNIPFPCERDVGFMIHIALGLRRNSSTNKL